MEHETREDVIERRGVEVRLELARTSMNRSDGLPASPASLADLASWVITGAVVDNTAFARLVTDYQGRLKALDAEIQEGMARMAELSPLNPRSPAAPLTGAEQWRPEDHAAATAGATPDAPNRMDAPRSLADLLRDGRILDFAESDPEAVLHQIGRWEEAHADYVNGGALPPPLSLRGVIAKAMQSRSKLDAHAKPAATESAVNVFFGMTAGLAVWMQAHPLLVVDRLMAMWKAGGVGTLAEAIVNAQSKRVDDVPLAANRPPPRTEPDHDGPLF